MHIQASMGAWHIRESLFIPNIPPPGVQRAFSIWAVMYLSFGAGSIPPKLALCATAANVKNNPPLYSHKLMQHA